MRIVSVIFGILLMAGTAWGDTHTVADCNGSADNLKFATAITASSNGDIVSVPAGTCTFTGSVTVNKEITIQGAGIDVTTINVSSGSAFSITNATNNWRITGFTINAPSVNYTGGYAFTGGTSKTGGFTGIRIDHNKITGFHYSFYLMGETIGVIYENTIVGMLWFEGHDHQWTEDTNLGQSDGWLFIEGNTFMSQDGIGNGHAITWKFGGRGVVRFNTVDDAAVSDNYRDPDPFDTHGNCHGGRGARAFEFYNNRFYRYGSETQVCCRALQLRGGTGVIYNNYWDTVVNKQYLWSWTWDDVSQPSEIYFYDQRLLGAGGTPPCPTDSGTVGAYCDPTSGGEGYPCWDQIGRGNAQALEPVYIWNNTRLFDAGASYGNYAVSPKVEAHETSYITEDRDYYVSATKPAAMSDYSAYTCPHPTTGYTGSCNFSVAGVAGYNVEGGDTTPIPIILAPSEHGGFGGGFINH
jgi:hypothetical protein